MSAQHISTSSAYLLRAWRIRASLYRLSSYYWSWLKGNSDFLRIVALLSVGCHLSWLAAKIAEQN